MFKDNTVVEVVVKPKRELYCGTPNEEGYVFRVMACEVDKKDKDKVLLNNFQNIIISGTNLTDLEIGTVRKAVLTRQTGKYEGYTARFPAETIPKEPKDQWAFLETVIPENQVRDFKRIFKTTDKIVEIIMSKKQDERIIYSVKGIGVKTIETLRTKILKRESYAKTYIALSEWELTDNMIEKINNKYDGDVETIKRIAESNIYLFTRVQGIGFKRIDEVYLKSKDSTKDNPFRVREGILFTLGEIQTNGNTRITERNLVQNAQKLLDIPAKIIKDELKVITLDLDKYDSEDSIFDSVKMIKENYTKIKQKIVKMNDGYSFLDTFLNEYYICNTIVTMSKTKPKIPVVNTDEWIAKFEKNNNFTLSGQQRAFFDDFFESSFQVLVGYGGTGKSTIQKGIIEYCKENNVKVELLAPTGVARKQLANSTGEKARTIHSFLTHGILPTPKKGASENPNKPTEMEVVKPDIYVIDESSMCDVGLMFKFFKAINKDTKVIILGDDAQIPSVSHGNFLYDVINSKEVSLNKLTRVFRQSEGGILDIATKTRQGRTFLPNQFSGRKVFGKDCVFDMRPLNKNKTRADQSLDAYKNVLEHGYKEEDILILTPTKKGSGGTVAINNKIQRYINPKSDSKEEFDSFTEGQRVTFRENDMVMWRENTRKDTYVELGGMYELEVGDDMKYKEIDIANGDIGRIVKISQSGSVYIKFDDGICRLEKGDFNSGKAIHAWCVTIHKSQGLGVKVVICVIDKSTVYQLNGNLLYTALTRAIDLALVLGDTYAINKCLSKFENLERDTNLAIFFSEHEKLVEKND